MGFDKLYEKYTKKYPQLLSEQEPGMMPPADPAMDAQPPADPAMQQPAPPPEAPKPLAPEGKVFLAELARKALLLSPDNIDGYIKEELAMNEATAENTEDILELISRAIGGMPERSEE